MKNILITGVNGFIGQNCYKYFSKNNDVYGIDLSGNAHNKKILIADVIEENITKFNVKFDFIIHLAGSGTVSEAQERPEDEKRKTLNSLESILEFMKNSNLNARLIFSSSASVYGDKHANIIKEDSQINPISLYGEHKVAAEALCTKYAALYDLDIKIIRFFSLYGIGCKKQLLYDVLTRIKNANSDILTCYGTGNEIRDFINIKDAIDFINIVMSQDKSFEVYNCGTGIPITVNKIINLLIKNSKKNIVPVYDNIERTGNPQSLVADINKAKELGFTPKIQIEEGVKEYVEWFKTL